MTEGLTQDALRERVYRWLVDDYEKRRREYDAPRSFVCRYLREAHEESFRVRVKRLAREALAGDVGGRASLLLFMIDELVDGLRLTRKGSRHDAMDEREELGHLVRLGTSERWVAWGEGCGVTKKAHLGRTRRALVNAQCVIRDDPSRAMDISDGNLLLVVGAMLECDHLPAKANPCERLMELREDVLWEAEHEVPLEPLVQRAITRVHAGEADPSDRVVPILREKVERGEDLLAFARKAMLAPDEGDFRALVDSYLEADADRLLADMGWRAPSDLRRRAGGDAEDLFDGIDEGEPSARGHARTRDLPLALVAIYLEGNDMGEADDNEMLRDLATLYLLLRDDESKAGAFVPAMTDQQTGVGLYLAGREWLGAYGQAPAAGRQVSVAAVDHRLAEPTGGAPVGRGTPAGGTQMVRFEKAFRGLGRAETRGMMPAPVSHLAMSYSLDRFLPGRPSESEVRRYLKDELHPLYQTMVLKCLRLSMRDEAVNGPAPEGCPERFAGLFS